MKATIFVGSGEVWATKHNVTLRADGIGSCMVIAAYDVDRRIGSLSHIMLPGNSSKAAFAHDTKYAADAVREMLFKMCRLGAVKERIEACILGGANVLKDEQSGLCAANIESVTRLLQENGIKVVVKAVGGVTRRWASLDIEDGSVSYAEGDSDEKQLYKWGA